MIYTLCKIWISFIGRQCTNYTVCVVNASAFFKCYLEIFETLCTVNYDFFSFIEFSLFFKSANSCFIFTEIHFLNFYVKDMASIWVHSYMCNLVCPFNIHLHMHWCMCIKSGIWISTVLKCKHIRFDRYINEKRL